MWRDTRDAVLDMRQACSEVLNFALGADLDRLEHDLVRLRAIERSLAILGEAAKHVPQTFRDAHPLVPWRKMAGLRDGLVHDYFDIDLEVLKHVIERELPSVQVELDGLIDGLGWDRGESGGDSPL